MPLASLRLSARLIQDEIKQIIERDDRVCDIKIDNLCSTCENILTAI